MFLEFYHLKTSHLLACTHETRSENNQEVPLKTSLIVPAAAAAAGQARQTCLGWEQRPEVGNTNRQMTRGTWQVHEGAVGDISACYGHLLTPVNPFEYLPAALNVLVFTFIRIMERQGG